jgi:hypothetical protein
MKACGGSRGIVPPIFNFGNTVGGSEVHALLGASSGNPLPTFRDNVGKGLPLDAA